MAGIKQMDGHPTLAIAEWDIVQRFLKSVEDERILVVPLDVDESYFDVSACALRDRCSESLAVLSPQSGAVMPLRLIRAACRRFVGEPHSGLFDFFVALGELRAGIGMQVANLVALFGFDLPIGLAAIVPADDPG